MLATNFNCAEEIILYLRKRRGAGVPLSFQEGQGVTILGAETAVSMSDY
jgi:hypothetical protein